MHCPYCQTNSSQSKNCPTCGAALQQPQPMTAKPLPVRTRLHHEQYQIRRVLGSGAYGVSYMALHKATLEVVTLKEYFPSDLVERNPNGNLIAKPGAQAAFLEGMAWQSKEVQALRLLRHPSIVPLHEVFQQFGTVYLVLDYLEGATLSAQIKQKPLDSTQAAKLCQHILGALAVVHQAGLLHRDLKPDNIVMTAGRAVLIDFGAVSALGKAGTTRLLTPAYAALEQYSHSAVLVPQTDLYAFAATLFEAVAGFPPPSALERANGTPLVIPSSVPEWMRLTLFDALSLRIDQRPISAHRMLRGLGLESEVRSFGPNSVAV